MSPRDRIFWETVQRRAAGLQPDVAAEVLKAFRILRESLSDAEVVKLIASGQIEKILDDALLDRAFLPLREKIRRATERSFDLTRHTDLPKSGKVDGVVAVQFDVLNPKVIDAIRELDSRVITDLTTDARTAIRAYVENGLRDGTPHKAIARDIRKAVGMSPSQVENAAKYRARLTAEEKLTEAQVDSRVAAYEKNAVSINAKTVARTATMDALKLGQKLSWDDAIAKGLVDGDRLVKTWVTVGDDRVRDEHRAMQSETVAYNQPYSNGQQIPGETEYNCRCVSRIRPGAVPSSLLAA